MDIKGARILAERIADADRRWRLKAAQASGGERRCVECGGEIPFEPAALGSVRCPDCRTRQPAS
jgi:hypothetical protein